MEGLSSAYVEINEGLSQIADIIEETLEGEDLVRRQARYDEISALIDEFCMRHISPHGMEYAVKARQLAAVCCQPGTPVVEGRAKATSWAAGIVYTVGWLNFLQDKSFEPTLTGEQVAAGFGVSVATMHAKSTMIRNGLEILPFDPEWTVPSRMEANPLMWLVELPNGVVVDTRALPRDQQERLVEAGVIPYVPGTGEAEGSRRGERDDQGGDGEVLGYVGPEH